MANVKKPTPEVKFYSSEPKAPKKKVADKAPLPSSPVGSHLPKMVPKHPAKMVSMGPNPRSIKPKAHGFGHTNLQKIGNQRFSGHPKAHRVGKA